MWSVQAKNKHTSNGNLYNKKALGSAHSCSRRMANSATLELPSKAHDLRTNWGRACYIISRLRWVPACLRKSITRLLCDAHQWSLSPVPCQTCAARTRTLVCGTIALLEAVTQESLTAAGNCGRRTGPAARASRCWRRGQRGNVWA